jgi:hypothetical protein
MVFGYETVDFDCKESPRVERSRFKQGAGIMAYSTKFRIASAVFAFGLVSGCGTYVPEIQEFYQSPHVGRELIDPIVAQVECEVKGAVQSAIIKDIDFANAPEVVIFQKEHGLTPGRKLAFLDTWAAQVTLTLTIDEKSVLSPGVSLNTPLPTAVTTFPHSAAVSTLQSFSLGFGGTASADATRKETLAFYIDFKKFTDKASLAKARLLKGQPGGPDYPCQRSDGIFIQSDLKFKEWLTDALVPTTYVEKRPVDFGKALAAEEKISKKDVISHEITFVILYGGNITPTWKLVRVSANTGSLPLFSAQRTKTQDLIITMGPPQNGGLSTAAQNTTLAAQIGQAVANAIRNTQ